MKAAVGQEAPTASLLQGAVDIQGSTSLLLPALRNDICVASPPLPHAVRRKKKTTPKGVSSPLPGCPPN